MSTISDDLIVAGNLIVNGALPAIARTSLTQESYSSFPIEMERARVFDAYSTFIITAGATDDDLGWSTGGTYGVDVPYITAGNVRTVSKTRRARILYQVPMNYVAYQAARIAFYCGMITTVADTSCTIDCEAFKVGTGGLVSGTDLVSTVATTMNGGPAGTFANVNFDLIVTGLNPGDWLDIRFTIANVDGATVGAVIPAISKIIFQAMSKG